MTSLEIQRATALTQVNLDENPIAKEFVRGMAFQGKNYPDREISERQSKWLSSLAWKYRDEIGALPDGKFEAVNRGQIGQGL
jgi:hypothetical protein